MLHNALGAHGAGHGMSDTSQGPGWWLASDGKWYPPELWTGPPDTGPPNSGPAVPTAQPALPAYPAHAPAYGATGTVPPGQPGYGQPGYGQPGYCAGGPPATYGYGGQYAPYGQGASYGQTAQRRTNGLAIASLICSCAGVFFLPAILGVVFGFVARSQITRSNGLQRGNGLAIAGIIVGFGWLALLVLGIALGASGNNNSGVIGPFI
jgi:hypothetical protein